MELTLSPHKAEKSASPTVTNSNKAEIPACRSLIYSHKAEISAWKFLEKPVKNNVMSGSSGSGDPMLWEVRGERVNCSAHVQDFYPHIIVSYLQPRLNKLLCTFTCVSICVSYNYSVFCMRVIN